MTVYVDDMYRFAWGRYRGMRMSHMIADSEEELHAMADEIGVARRWYQGDHYDISMTKRQLAVRNGAVELTIREMATLRVRQTVRRRRDAALTDEMRSVDVSAVRALSRSSYRQYALVLACRVAIKTSGMYRVQPERGSVVKGICRGFFSQEWGSAGGEVRRAWVLETETAYEIACMQLLKESSPERPIDAPRANVRNRRK